jgi:class 3 adenylate cyclase/tetratricopeptide (TPR) repeat protein
MDELNCSTCGATWPESLDMSYCGHCSSPLEEQQAPEDSKEKGGSSHRPEAVEGELRYATVLFADIKGFTSFSEDRPPDQVANVVGDLLEKLGEAVRSEGGSVDKYIGDAVMATFGLIEPNPHAARTAVRSAFQMQHNLEEFCRESDYEFSLRIGIHAGEMVRVSVDDSFTVMGDSVNTAARIEGEAPPGGVLISDPVKKSLRGWGGFRKESEVELKGKSGKTALYVPLREEDREMDAEGDVLDETRFVGRDEELRSIRSILDESVQEQDMRLAFVRGETGVGKSRFMDEVAASGEDEGMARSVVKYDQMFSGMLDGIGQMVADFFGLQLPGEPNELLDRIRQLLDQRYTWIPEDRRDVVTEFFGFLIGIEQESFEIYDLPAETKLETAWAELKNWLQGFSREQPVLLCFEDVQNGDENTARFLEWCLDVTWEGPVTFLASVREEELQEGSEWQNLIDSSVERSVEQEADAPAMKRIRTLRLGAMERDALSTALGTALPGPVNESVTGRIAEYCEGNPLFGVETLRELIEKGMLGQQEDGSWDLEVPWEEVELPETVREVMEARLQRLPRTGIDLAKRGGVVGQRFFLEAVRGLFDDSDASLEDGMDVLQAQNLLFCEPSQFVKNLEEGVFQNSRFRRAAEARATNTERRDWMESVANWGEQAYEEVDNRSIAGQVLLPLVARALDESEQPGRSRMVYEWAGWLLYENNRLEEAVNNFQKALFGDALEEVDENVRKEFGRNMFQGERADRPTDALLTVREAQIRLMIGKAQEAQGMIGRSLDTLRPVASLLSSIDAFDGNVGPPLLADQPELRSAFDEADHRWWELSPEESAILNQIELVDLEIKNGNMDRASSLVQEARDRFGHLRSSVPDERKRHLYANWLYKKIWMKGESMGQPVEALEELQPIYQGNDPIVGDIEQVSPTNRADLSHLRSTLLFFTGELEEARSEEQKVLEYWQDEDRSDKEAPSLNLLGNIHRGLGKYHEAEEYFSEARDIYQNLGRRLEEAKTLGNLGSVFINRGELNRAEEAFAGYRDISQEIGFHQGEATALGNLGLVFLERGELEQAGDCFERQIEISRRIQDRQGEVLALGNLGFVHHDRGEIEDALACYREQLSISREIGYRYGEEVALGSLAELLRNRFSGAIEGADPEPSDPVEAYEFTESAIERADASGNRKTRIHMLLNRAILLRWADAGMSDFETPGHDDHRETGLERLREELRERSQEEMMEPDRRAEQIDTALELCESAEIEPSLHAELLIERARQRRLEEDQPAITDLLDRAAELIDQAREQGADVQELDDQLEALSR